MFSFPPAKAKADARTEYRVQEGQRVQESRTLAQKFPNLNSLSVTLEFFRPQGVVQIGSLKQTFNLDHAKSVLRVDCPNPECVEGDFDLSAELAKAVSALRKTVTGQIICQGWRDNSAIGGTHCQHVLRFRLSLGYKKPAIESGRKTV